MVCNTRLTQELSCHLFYYPSYGWITTNGVYGKRNWSGSFYGNISFGVVVDYVNDKSIVFYYGVTNFVGLKLRYSVGGERQVYMGFASQVATSSSNPWP